MEVGMGNILALDEAVPRNKLFPSFAISKGWQAADPITRVFNGHRPDLAVTFQLIFPVPDRTQVVATLLGRAKVQYMCVYMYQTSHENWERRKEGKVSGPGWS